MQWCVLASCGLQWMETMKFADLEWARMSGLVAGSGLSEWRIRQLMRDGIVRFKLVDGHRIGNVQDLLRHIEAEPASASKIANLGRRRAKPTDQPQQ
jgi:hypothetical protein